jgi:MOSC domain-containing protein YiiM
MSDDSTTAPTGLSGELVAVSVGGVRDVHVGSRVVETGIWKSPVSWRVPVQGVNLAGDDQADRTVHGGPDKAVYAYASEDTTWWEEQVGRALGPGAFGENLTTRGLDLSSARIGDRWRVGSTLLEVRQTRIPCFKLGLRMGDPHFLKAFANAGRPGAYLGILEEGDVGARDRIDVVFRPDHDITMALMSEALLHDAALRPRLLEATALPQFWRDWLGDG